MRRTLLLLVLGALLYGLGLQAARACLPTVLPTHVHFDSVAAEQRQPCHDDAVLTKAVCESHCRNNAQNSRVSVSFDLPAAAPMDSTVPMAPVLVVAAIDNDFDLPLRDSGPPFHILFHRFLR